MNEWTEESLGRLASIEIGGTPSRDVPAFWANENAEGFPWASIADLGPRFVSATKERITWLGVLSSNVKPVKSGTMMMSFKLTIGRAGIAACDLFTNEAIAAFVPEPQKLDGNFLYYLLPPIARNAVTDVAIKGSTLNKQTLSKLKLRFPKNIRQQRRIAEILSTLDEAIEQTEALIAKHQQIKAGLMHDLFTRGVTPDGHLRPTREQAPDLYKESPLGWIPKEWEVAPLSSAFSVSSGESLSEANRKPGEHQVYGGNGLAGTHDSFTFADPRLIIGRVGEYCGNPYVTDPKSWVTDNALVVSFYRTTRHLQFWRFLLQRIDLRRFAYAAAQPVVTGGQLGKLMHPVICEDEQRQIEDRLLAIEQLVEDQQDYLSKLRQQKHGLMHDLLTGRVRVLPYPGPLPAGEGENREEPAHA